MNVSNIKIFIKGCKFTGRASPVFHRYYSNKKNLSTSTNTKGPTGILMMNLGGPSTLDEVYDFLFRLFSDKELIPIPFQSTLAPWIARRRTPSIKDQYSQIGGGSPIKKWTKKQGELLAKLLDKISPDTAPHIPYIAFRYAEPLTSTAIESIQKDGVKRVVAFTQYPQYSCSTTGSSLNELYRKIKETKTDQSIEWSVIDRWPTHHLFIKAVVDRIESKLAEIPKNIRDQVTLLFSAHSLPMSVVNRGDQYPSEVAATVSRVVEALPTKLPYHLVWQSQVGPSAWLGPQTSDAIENLGKRGQRHLLTVPIAFTSDHIETLFELDLEYGELAHKSGIENFMRAESLNDSPLFIEALANIVNDHIKSESKADKQLQVRCPGCTNENCVQSKQFFSGE